MEKNPIIFKEEKIMDENIKEAVTETAEKVVEKTVENVDPTDLKDVGLFGAGIVVGIVAYRKILTPAWHWIQEKRRRKTHIVKTKKAKPEKVDDEEVMDEESDE